MGIMTRAYRNISRRKTRAILVILALAVSMAIMTSIPAGINANQIAMQQTTENYSKLTAEMQQTINETMKLITCEYPYVDPSIFPGAESYYFSETDLNYIASIRGVKEIVPFLQYDNVEMQSTSTQDGRQMMQGGLVYRIKGIDLNASLLINYLPGNITEGRNLQKGESSAVVIGKDLKEYFHADLGDTINIKGKSFTIVGIHELTGMDPRNIYMSLTDAQELLNLTGKVNTLDVYAEDSSLVGDITNTIDTAYPYLVVTGYQQRLQQLNQLQGMYDKALKNAESSLNQTEGTARGEIALAVTATSLIVLLMMFYAVRERTKEIGTLKAIGFSNWDVMSQFILEGVLISMLAGLVGIAVGTFATPMLSSLLLPQINTNLGTGGSPLGGGTIPLGNQSSITATADLQVAFIMFGVIVLLGAIGSLYPAWRAAKTRPVEALKYE
ncbi:MAG TPA: FtsX-like permease family protein [Candidatus Bathyarchaeia archaeon]|nr:FtsX-like permease family protein [Candidatus Bathyarchaeia archaeon]